ncbi:hypothetical protein PSAB6_30405 [Paraburkholderia sabiae]|nr:hypothetical protein PSAB6_30405 [Paraburkholderia sabiae]
MRALPERTHWTAGARYSPGIAAVILACRNACLLMSLLMQRSGSARAHASVTRWRDRCRRREHRCSDPICPADREGFCPPLERPTPELSISQDIQFFWLASGQVGETPLPYDGRHREADPRPEVRRPTFHGSSNLPRPRAKIIS